MLSRAQAFGLVWQADTALDHFSPCADSAAPADVDVRQIEAPAARSAITNIHRGAVFHDGVRFAWGDEVVFDMYSGQSVDYVPGNSWTGRLPQSFYSTVAALTVAWRGSLAIHASAVAVDDKATLICGQAGAGKSTLTAGLVSLGARFLSDDLSVVDWCPTRRQFVAIPGRPSIRLHPATAGWLCGATIAPKRSDESGKSLVTPTASACTTAVPVANLIWLNNRMRSVPPVLRPAVLQAQLFRPKWQSHLPRREERQLKLRKLADAVNLVCTSPVRIDGRLDFDASARRVLGVLRSQPSI